MDILRMEKFNYLFSLKVLLRNILILNYSLLDEDKNIKF
jgi:hypothetical protein